MPYFVILSITIMELVISIVGGNFWGKSFIPAPMPILADSKPPVVMAIPLTQAVVPKIVPAVPTARLKIQKIGVDAVIKEMGYTSDGAMAVPSNGIDVGWFSLGTRPGDTGSAVIGAHNFWNSKPGMFAHLDQLVKGDVLSVVDAKGVSTFFVVRDKHTYDAMDTNTGIFGSESGAHLNLITCSGDWDLSTKSPKNRLVIFTDVVQPPIKS